MADLEKSSVISSAKEFNVKQQLGDQCIVCGYPEPVDVVHIIARNESAKRLLDKLRSWSPQLAGFSKDQIENFLVLCPNHHRQYNDGTITIVPAPKTRQRLHEHEIADFKRRQQEVDRGLPDPGRQLLIPPALVPDFEFITLEPPHRVFFHMPTTYWPHSLIYDTQGVLLPYPIQSWPLFVYPVLLAACQPLNTPLLIRTSQSEAARDGVNELVRLYNRQIVPIRPEPPSVTASQLFQADLEKYDRRYPVRNTTSIQESAHDEMEATGEGLGEGSGQPSFRTSTERNKSQLEDENPMEVGTKDLLAVDDPVVTPAVLSSRLRWIPIKSEYGDVGSMRFATSSDFVRDINEPTN
ncbi:hypothetical protein FRC04_008340 [Tulasnella sp. 424]|nr:hypothetical protein FRC04_008340 [Tulasnella sp. 424]KAG8968375.1 hypothetical protein FRC05_001599 [Tulasnella sp. 425]